MWNLYFPVVTMYHIEERLLAEEGNIIFSYFLNFYNFGFKFNILNLIEWNIELLLSVNIKTLIILQILLLTQEEFNTIILHKVFKNIFTLHGGI